MKKLVLIVSIGILLFSCKKKDENYYEGGYNLDHLYKNGVDVTSEIQCTEADSVPNGTPFLRLSVEGPIGSDMDYETFSIITYCKDTLIQKYGAYVIKDKKIYLGAQYSLLPEQYGPIGAEGSSVWDIVKDKKHRLTLETNFEENGQYSLYRLELK